MQKSTTVKKKKAAKKRKYQKRKIVAVDNDVPQNRELLGLILQGVDRLGPKDKAQILAHVLKGRPLHDNELWAIQRILG